MQHITRALVLALSISVIGTPLAPTPASALSAPRPATKEVPSKSFGWSNDATTGDCRIMDRRVTFFADGRARFEARVRSSDSDDAWVYFGGLKIYDKNDSQLWESGKLIGPSMPNENVDYTWDHHFSYPEVWYSYIRKVRLFGGHC